MIVLNVQDATKKILDGSVTKLKKAELAKKAEEAVKDTNWLPSIMKV